MTCICALSCSCALVKRLLASQTDGYPVALARRRRNRTQPPSPARCSPAAGRTGPERPSRPGWTASQCLVSSGQAGAALPFSRRPTHACADGTPCPPRRGRRGHPSAGVVPAHGGRPGWGGRAVPGPASRAARAGARRPAARARFPPARAWRNGWSWWVRAGWIRAGRLHVDCICGASLTCCALRISTLGCRGKGPNSALLEREDNSDLARAPRTAFRSKVLPTFQCQSGSARLLCASWADRGSVISMCPDRGSSVVVLQPLYSRPPSSRAPPHLSRAAGQLRPGAARPASRPHRTWLAGGPSIEQTLRGRA